MIIIITTKATMAIIFIVLFCLPLSSFVFSMVIVSLSGQLNFKNKMESKKTQKGKKQSSEPEDLYKFQEEKLNHTIKYKYSIF